MAETTTTTFINLTLPVPTVRLGPTWASDIVTAFETIDAHDHTSGKGKQIPTAGLNIDASLSFNSNQATTLEAVTFVNRTSSPTGATYARGVSVFNGNLYFTNGSGTAIQLTSGGSIVSSPGNAQIFELQDVSADLIIAPADTFVYMTIDTTASRQITLPLASGVSAGRIYIVKDKDGQANSNNITVVTQGSDTVDGGSSQVLDSDYGSWTIIGDGNSAWYIS